MATPPHHDLSARPSKDSFWSFARRMLRYRLLVALTLVMVLISGMSLGVGMLGAKPVMQSILGEKQELRDLAAQANDKLAALPSFVPHGQLSQAFIDQLPAGPMNALVVVMAL